MEIASAIPASNEWKIEKKNTTCKSIPYFPGYKTFLFSKPLLKAGATYAPVRPFYGFQLGRGQLNKI